MKLSKRPLVAASLLAASSGVRAQQHPVPPTPLHLVGQQIFANNYVSAGTDSIINGNVLTGSYLTVGADSKIDGDTVAVAATTLGAGAETLDLWSGTAVTLGAGSGAKVVRHGTAFTRGAAATTAAVSGGEPTPQIHGEQGDAASWQTGLTALPPTQVLVPGSIAADVTYSPGVYQTAGLRTFAADTIIELDADDKDAEFVFNISSYLTFGARVEVKVINQLPGKNVRVIWNIAGGYVAVGAGANIVGTVIAKSYVSIGANATIRGIADLICGGAVYSTTSYVSVGAGATVGSTC
ncbi:ice-binding family protein [Ilumatobacter sp.]|uniref:ice-binding family protein n=1 Tax=Ilumatobacter sp. TaxID=1967498 RepID=UPI00375219E4